jgi:hypothetical protein
MEFPYKFLSFKLVLADLAMSMDFDFCEGYSSKGVNYKLHILYSR